MKLSTSTTNRCSPGPAPAFHARASVSPSTRSSWRTCPKVNARRNVPSVEGAGIHPNSRFVRPARRHVGVIDAVPTEHHREDQRHHLAPRVLPPRPITRSDSARPTSPSIPSRPASVATSATPTPATTRSSSNVASHAVQSERPVILHHTSDLLTPGPGCPYSLKKPCHIALGGLELARAKAVAQP